jgi:bifunctional non-homologous end joining protein LigD
MSLDEYFHKRRLSQTPEPRGSTSRVPGRRRFSFQRHDARRLHYDLRLEVGETLKSWAVPKGPSLTPGERKLAVRTEDHPLAYLDWEGVIPEGQYGAGVMMVYDIGHWEPVESQDPEASLQAGELKLRLWGQKVQGEWTLVRTQDNSWLFLKKDDAWADPEWDPEEHLWSAVSGRTPAEIADQRRAPTPRTKDWPKGAVKGPLPLEVEPARPRPGQPFDDDDWLFELAWDGVRALAFCQEQSLRLVGRQGDSLGGSFPEFRWLRSHLAAESFLLDGVLVVLDQEGKPAPARLRARLQAASLRAFREAARNDRAVYYVFDLLYLDGHDLRGCPLEKRRELLEQVLRPDPWVRLSETVRGMGVALFELARQQGVEALVAKRRDSLYASTAKDIATAGWRKLQVRHSQTGVVVGYRQGRRENELSMLQLARYNDQHELFALVELECGWDLETAHQLLLQLGSLQTSEKLAVQGLGRPGKAFRWVRPELVVEFDYQEQDRQGALREARFVRSRPDLSAQDCADRPPRPKEAFLEVDGHSLTLTNPGKVLFPSGFSKRDLVEYYDEIAGLMLPHLRDRPLSLRRYPDGIEGEDFFQKHPGAGTPDWIATMPYGRGVSVLARNRATLVYLANLACVELHVTLARAPNMETPDGFLLDFDPQGAPFSAVKLLAASAGEILQQLGWKGWVKTSGGRGLHVFIPLASDYDFEQSRMAAGVFAEILRARHPEQVTLERVPAKRPRNTVYIDAPQNRKAATMASVYSVRANPEARVSMPLRWEELGSDVDPRDFTLANGLSRAAEVSQLWSMLPLEEQRLEDALPRLEVLLQESVAPAPRARARTRARRAG